MAMELEALDEAGRKELAQRVSEMQRKHALAVMTLTTQEERLAYVKGIPADVSMSFCAPVAHRFFSIVRRRLRVQ